MNPWDMGFSDPGAIDSTGGSFNWSNVIDSVGNAASQIINATNTPGYSTYGYPTYGYPGGYGSNYPVSNPGMGSYQYGHPNNSNFLFVLLLVGLGAFLVFKG